MIMDFNFNSSRNITEKKTDSAKLRAMKSEIYKTYMENISPDIIPVSKQLERFKSTLR